MHHTLAELGMQPFRFLMCGISFQDILWQGLIEICTKLAGWFLDGLHAKVCSEFLNDLLQSY